MTLPTSGPISRGNIRTEFGGPTPVVFSNYYKNGAYVHAYSNAPNVPTSGTIKTSDFYGASNNAAPAVTWITPANQSMQVGDPFTLTLNATNAVSYTLTANSFPTGLTLTGSVVSGTPTTAQTTYPAITATSTYNVSNTQVFTFAVNSWPAPSWNTDPNQSLVQNQPFTLTLDATNAVSYALTSGSFPTGISLNGAVVSGTPTTVQTTTPVITATSIHNISTPQSFNFAVASAPINPLNASATTGTNYQLPGFWSGASTTFNTQDNYVQVTWDSIAGGSQNWSIVLSGGLSSANVDANIYGGWESGTFTSSDTTTVLGFTGPHSSGTATVTVSKAGYSDYTTTLNIPSSSTYTPYTYTNGFTQAYTWTGANLILAQQINETYYESNDSFIVSNSVPPINTPQRWGLKRRGEADGISFWVQQCINNSWTISSQGLIDAIFTSAASNYDHDASLSSTYPVRAGTGYGDFNNAP